MAAYAASRTRDVRTWIRGVQRFGLPAMIYTAAPTGSIAVATFAKLRGGDRRVALAWRAVVAAMRGKPRGLREALEPLIAMRAEPWFRRSTRAHCAALAVLRLGQSLCVQTDRDWVYADVKHLGIAKRAPDETLAARAITDGVMACVAATFQPSRVRDAMSKRLVRYARSEDLGYENATI